MKLDFVEELRSFIARFQGYYRKVEDSRESVNEKHCCQLLQNLLEDYDYLVREFVSLKNAKFNFSHIQVQILKESARRELQECLKQEALVTSSNVLKEETKPRNELKLKCKLCNEVGRIEKFCK